MLQNNDIFVIKNKTFSVQAPLENKEVIKEQRILLRLGETKMIMKGVRR